jgi:hypothetical protein
MCCLGRHRQGFALDMRTAGTAVMRQRVSVNGSFGEPNGFTFSDMNAPFLSPIPREFRR